MLSLRTSIQEAYSQYERAKKDFQSIGGTLFLYDCQELFTLYRRVDVSNETMLATLHFLPNDFVKEEFTQIYLYWSQTEKLWPYLPMEKFTDSLTTCISKYYNTVLKTDCFSAFTFAKRSLTKAALDDLIAYEVNDLTEFYQINDVLLTIEWICVKHLYQYQYANHEPKGKYHNPFYEIFYGKIYRENTHFCRKPRFQKTIFEYLPSPPRKVKNYINTIDLKAPDTDWIDEYLESER